MTSKNKAARFEKMRHKFLQILTERPIRENWREWNGVSKIDLN
jgi:hypothetical protein